MPESTNGMQKSPAAANQTPSKAHGHSAKGQVAGVKLVMPPRAKPFSGRQKRQQLQEKRLRKRQDTEDASSPQDSPRSNDVNANNNGGSNRLKLISKWEPKGAQAKPKAYENPLYHGPISSVDPASTVVDVSNFYEQSSIDIPSRPPWSAEMTKEALERNEEKYFAEWLDYVYKTCPPDQLGYFEHNLEVWRQFWRVCEISDVIVIVLDVRYPILHFPLSLHRYLVERLHTPFIIAIMKCDLLDDGLIGAWMDALRRQFGGNTSVCKVSIYQLPDDENAAMSKKRYHDSTGVEELIQHCRELTGDRYASEWNDLTRSNDECEAVVTESAPSGDREFITIGTLGHPNVGKSSLINSIVGKKVVSASKTPGHTKHFQTIHLSKHIRLCDCPGLIFPVALPQNVQILNGLYNVAQVRDPFGPISVACKMAHLPGVLGLRLPDGESYWSVISICEQFAIQRGFFTSKAGRPDAQRAANLILRMILDGRVLIAWRPASYAGGSIARHVGAGDDNDALSGGSSVESELGSDESDRFPVRASNPFALLPDE